MTDKEYKVVVKLLIEELEKCRDEIFRQQEEIEMLRKNSNFSFDLSAFYKQIEETKKRNGG